MPIIHGPQKLIDIHYISLHNANSHLKCLNMYESSCMEAIGNFTRYETYQNLQILFNSRVHTLGKSGLNLLSYHHHLTGHIKG